MISNHTRNRLAASNTFTINVILNLSHSAAPKGLFIFVQQDDESASFVSKLRRSAHISGA